MTGLRIRRRQLGITLTVGALVAASAFAFANLMRTTSQPGASGTTVDRIVTDRVHPPTFDALVRSSHLVVVGVLETEQVEYARSSDGQLSHVATSFRVERVLRGDVRPGDVIAVARTLSASGEPLAIDAEAPLVPDQRYLLVLRNDYEDVFAAVGGGQGEFAVRDGRLVPLAPTFASSADLEGKTPEEAAAVVGQVP